MGKNMSNVSYDSDNNFWRATIHASWAISIACVILGILGFLSCMSCLGLCTGMLGAFLSLFGI